MSDMPRVGIDAELTDLENEYDAYAEEYKERYFPTWVMRAMALMRRQQQQRDELAEALGILHEEVSNERESFFQCHSTHDGRTPDPDDARILEEIDAKLSKARAALAKYRQPQEAPELFPGTLEKLRGLGKQK